MPSSFLTKVSPFPEGMLPTINPSTYTSGGGDVRTLSFTVIDDSIGDLLSVAG